MNALNAFMNEVNWLVSLLVAIPLSIAGNILTPVFLNWRARRSRSTAVERANELERELAQLEEMARDTGRLNSHLLVSLLLAMVFFALPGVVQSVSSLLIVMPALSLSTSSIGTALAAVHMASGTLFNLMAILVAWRAISTYRRVRAFEESARVLRLQIERLKSAA